MTASMEPTPKRHKCSDGPGVQEVGEGLADNGEHVPEMGNDEYDNDSQDEERVGILGSQNGDSEEKENCTGDGMISLEEGYRQMESDNGESNDRAVEEERHESKGRDFAREPSKIVRSQSAWMIFLAENRTKVREENPGLSIGPLQKILSEKWKQMDEKEKDRLNKLAAEDKARMKRELKEAGLTKLPSGSSKAGGGESDGHLNGLSAGSGNGQAEGSGLVLPLARVRKAVRLDPSVGNISKEGLHLVAKATEVFMATTAERVWKVAQQTGRKSIKPCDLADCVFSSPEMYWLRDEFRSERSAVANRGASGAKRLSASKVAPAPKGTKSITSFFGKA